MTLGECGRDWGSLEINLRADPLLADELNSFYGRFECNRDKATLPISVSGSSRQSSDDHVITVSEGTKASERQESSWTWWDYWPCSVVLRWSACLVCLLQYLISPLLPLLFPPTLKKSVIIPMPKNNKPSCLNGYCPVALTSIVMKGFWETFKEPDLLLHPWYFGPSSAQIDLLTMPSLTSCTLPSHT